LSIFPNLFTMIATLAIKQKSLKDKNIETYFMLDVNVLSNLLLSSYFYLRYSHFIHLTFCNVEILELRSDIYARNIRERNICVWNVHFLFRID
jgi:hypothetical protein